MNYLRHAMLMTMSLCSLILAGCASGPRIVTMEAFHNIPVGATREEVIAQAGEPYTSKKQEDGTEELRYVERLQAGARVLQEREYILILKDGRVSSKRIEQKNPSPNSFDSYEMQTTHNLPS